MPYVEYHANNSGGSWWMSDDDWKALADAGWEVEWAEAGDPYSQPDAKGVPRYLGARATRAKFYLDFNATTKSGLRQAIASFNSVTSCNASDLGCSCCGTPHSFTFREDDGKYIESWSPSFPTRGDEYGY